MKHLVYAMYAIAVSLALSFGVGSAIASNAALSATAPSGPLLCPECRFTCFHGGWVMPNGVCNCCMTP